MLFEQSLHNVTMISFSRGFSFGVDSSLRSWQFCGRSMTEPRKRAAEPAVEKPPAGIRWVFQCRPFEHLFINLINQANHRTVCHMKLVFTGAKIKTSYELLLCVDDGKGRYSERARRARKAF